ncbi:MAG: hypothetical protein ACK4QP_16105 [Pseudorhizobium sp.]
MAAVTGVEMAEAMVVEMEATEEPMAAETPVAKEADMARVVLRPTRMVPLQEKAEKTIAGKASHEGRRQK